MTFREYIKLAFCDNGEPSSSRLMFAATTLTSMVALLAIVFKTWHMPDGTTLGGLSVYAASPYAINRASKMIGRDKDDDTTVDASVVVKKKD